MKLTAITLPKILFGFCFFLFLSSAQSWALTISTTAKASSYYPKYDLFDEKIAHVGSIYSHVENTSSYSGIASAFTSDNGNLMVASKASAFANDCGSPYIAKALWSDVINNSSNKMLKYYLDLDISQIIMKTIVDSTASYNISILLNNVQIWSVSSFLGESSWEEPNEKIIDPYSKSILLGEYDVNRSFNLEYSISAICSAFEVGTSQINPFTVSGNIRTARAAPEPSTLVLLGAGLGGLVIWRRKTRD
jgi:hypothetical protein